MEAGSVRQFLGGHGAGLVVRKLLAFGQFLAVDLDGQPIDFLHLRGRYVAPLPSTAAARLQAD